MRFPLSFVPTQDWNYHGKEAGRSKLRGKWFGALRDGGRLHAACDLIAPKGTEIYAVDDGTVIQGKRAFYRGTYSLVVQHSHFIVRYCEIEAVARGLGVGSKVGLGDVIAHVGKMYYDSMLHFEMYSGSAGGEFTDRASKPYERRSDLVDPTAYLNGWAREMKSGVDRGAPAG